MNLQSTSFCIENARELARWASRAYTDAPTISDAKTDTQVLIVDCGDYITANFRGTSNLRDFVTDAKAWRVKTRFGYVHAGIWEAWESVEDRVLGELRALGDKPIFPGGHSLGGSLSHFCSCSAREAGLMIHSNYAFGAPRDGDKDWQKIYNATPMRGSPFLNLGAATFTLINDCDVVPRIPGWLAGYRRPGHDEFISLLTPNHADEDPSLCFRLFSDAMSLYDAWSARRDPLRG